MKQQNNLKKSDTKKKDPKRDYILQFFHCENCSKDHPVDISMRDWARLECGWTKKGFQVRCVRCDLNIIAIDFMGQKVDYD